MNLNWIRFMPSDANDVDPEDPIDPGDDNGGNSDGATPATVTFQAEDYDEGGQGVAYNDTTAANEGGAYRNDAVDIEMTENGESGYNVGWIAGGEWLKYTVKFAADADYTIQTRVARYLWSTDFKAQYHVEIDGKDVTGAISVADTGGWQNWKTVNVKQVAVTGGTHEVKLVMHDGPSHGMFNINWVKFIPDGVDTSSDPDPTPPTPDPTPPPPPTPTPPPTGGTGYDSSKAGPKSTITCSGVTINPGDNIASKANSNSEGTTFCLKKGTYYSQSVTPKSGQTFIGEVGTVLDGQNKTTYAFYSWSASSLNVTIKNMEIKNYSNSQYFGAINHFVGNPNWYSNPVYGSGGWTVKNCYIHNNNAVGIALGRDDVVVENNILNYNEQEGISLRFGSNQRVFNNEIAYNNSNVKYEWGNEAGGSKFWETTNMVLDSNYVHDNHGPGLWSDHGNKNTTYANNTITNNFSSGIFHEISYAATITNNTIKNNGHGWTGWLWGAGIQIANSGYATIHDNYLEDNNNGIAFSDQGRGYGPLSGTVYNNTIKNSGTSGVVSDTGSFPSGPFNFHDNTFIGSGTTGI
jgi:hypothetical protein